MSDEAIIEEAKLLYSQLPGRKPWEKLDPNQREKYLAIARFTLDRMQKERESVSYGWF